MNIPTGPYSMTQAAIQPETSPLAIALMANAYQLVPALIVGASPIVLGCYDDWKPILEVMCEKFGYCWEWVPDDEQISPMKWGKAVLTKVTA